MLIERLPAGDWERYRDIRLASLLDTPDAFGSTHAGEATLTPADWQARLARPDVATLVAVVDGQDLGTMVVAPSFGDPDVAGIYGVWVAPAGRGRGIGDALLAAAVEAARAASTLSLIHI